MVESRLWMLIAGAFFLAATNCTPVYAQSDALSDDYARGRALVESFTEKAKSGGFRSGCLQKNDADPRILQTMSEAAAQLKELVSQFSNDPRLEMPPTVYRGFRIPNYTASSLLEYMYGDYEHMLSSWKFRGILEQERLDRKPLGRALAAASKATVEDIGDSLRRNGAQFFVYYQMHATARGSGTASMALRKTSTALPATADLFTAMSYAEPFSGDDFSGSASLVVEINQSERSGFAYFDGSEKLNEAYLLSFIPHGSIDGFYVKLDDSWFYFKVRSRSSDKSPGSWAVSKTRYDRNTMVFRYDPIWSSGERLDPKIEKKAPALAQLVYFIECR